MNKSVKRCYEYLDLPIDASEQIVTIRKTALIRIYKTKAAEKGVSYTNQIRRVETAAKKIIDNIKNNGIPQVKKNFLSFSWTTVSILFSVFIVVGLLCFFSFYVLL